MAENSTRWTLEQEKKHIDKLGTHSEYGFDKVDLLKKYKTSLRLRSKFGWSFIREGNNCHSKMKPKDNIKVITELENYVNSILEGK